MSAPTVLYDAPGPRAKQRNMLYAGLFIVVLGLLGYLGLAAMNDENQLDWDKWSPYLAGTEAWTTYLLPGLKGTLIAAGLSILMALPIGALFGIARLSDHAWIAKTAGTLVEFFRSIPVLILMFFANTLYALLEFGRDVRPLYAVCTGLVIYNAAVIAEVVRAGIMSLPKGQSEAALAVGMRKGQLMTNVLLPQAVTAMLPALVSQLVVIVKDTALGGVLLNYSELMSTVSEAAGYYGGNIIATLTVVAGIYIVLNSLLTWFAGWLEQRMRRSKKGTGAVVGGAMMEEQAPGMGITETPAAH